MLELKIDFREVMKTLEQLPEKMQKEMMEGAVRAGARVIKKEADSRTPLRKGNLFLSLSVKKNRTRSPFLTIYNVKYSQGGGSRGKGYHAHLLEFGHEIWRRKKRPRLPEGQSYAAMGKKYEMEPTGKRTRGRYMLTKAFDNQASNAIRKIAAELSVDKIERKVLSRIRRYSKRTR